MNEIFESKREKKFFEDLKDENTFMKRKKVLLECTLLNRKHGVFIGIKNLIFIKKKLKIFEVSDNKSDYIVIMMFSLNIAITDMKMN
jgi:hypothetical protein